MREREQRQNEHNTRRRSSVGQSRINNTEPSSYYQDIDLDLRQGDPELRLDTINTEPSSHYQQLYPGHPQSDLEFQLDTNSAEPSTRYQQLVIGHTQNDLETRPQDDYIHPLTYDDL